MVTIQSDPLIDSIQLYERKQAILRLDVGPFLAIYPILFIIYQFIEKTFRGYVLLLLAVCIVAQLVLFLSVQWSQKIRCIIGRRKTNSVDKAEWVLVRSQTNRYHVANLIRRKFQGSIPVGGNSFKIFPYYFEFQKIVFEFDTDKQIFFRQVYPTSGKLSEFRLSNGHSMKTFELSLLYWNLNDFDIPLPDFLQLFVDHLIAPFFVFQTICLVLWSLDDYWYYSFFTFVMLLFFEGMMCRQRQNNVLMLRSMRRPIKPILAYRSNKWGVVSSDSIVPGDIISVQSISDEGFSEGEGSIIPCDLLLLHGSCVTNEAMLTGESIPQVKESISKNCDDVFDINCDNGSVDNLNKNILLGGTSIVYSVGETIHSKYQIQNWLDENMDKHCIGIVLRTGFSTTQGDLVRKILYASEKVNKEANVEIFYFITILIVFAIVASLYVLYYGLMDSSRNKFRLVLHCVMIITSVIPPELPMELSLAVTHSLAALSKVLIFCTEPYRISYGGKLDVIAFDKTGTLTQDKIELLGIGMPSPITDDYDPAAIFSFTSQGSNDSIEVSKCSNLVVTAIASCQNIIMTSKGPAGDTLELTSFKSSDFSIIENSKFEFNDLYNKERDIHCSILLRFPFSSTLKRMSVIAKVKLGVHERKYFAFVKGAPEVLEDRLRVVPSFYRSISNYHMSKGRRVLTLAFKMVENYNESIIRDEVENNLVFLGFLLFDSKLKVDSKSVIKELRSSNHKVIVVTGDSLLTAIDVSRKLGILCFKQKSIVEIKSILILMHNSEKSNSVFFWRKVEYFDRQEDAFSSEFHDIAFNIKNISELCNTNEICIAGPVLNELVSFNRTVAKSICDYVTVFARMSPSQKAFVLSELSVKFCTLMCGDGTNDVGALKASHVGVSVINDPLLEDKLGQVKSRKNQKNKQDNKDGRLDRALAELQEVEKDPTIIKLGDASLASPFTARRTSIDSVLSIIRQGRCTLVTTIQIYKILALNCLVSAYNMSVLHLSGLKQGDIQMTAMGLVTAGLFLFLSQTSPTEQISVKRPPHSIFCKSVYFSIIGQFLCHFCCLVLTVAMCSNDDLHESKLLPDGQFQPNLVNSALFLLTMVISINNFVINYRGDPYTQNLSDNKSLWRSVLGLYFVVIIIAGGQITPLNDLLQMSQFPSSSFQTKLVLLLLVDFIGSYFVERYSRTFE